MATIKSYTDLDQSKKLAKILPIESADMWYSYYGNSKYNPTIAYKGQQWFLCQIRNSLHDDVSCWSLAALINILPKTINNETLFIETSPALWHIGYRNIYTARVDNIVDACVELILKLKELNLL